MVFVSWSPSTVTVGTETTATFTFNDDDVSWVYVDWGDGEDNSLDNAIYHWERLKTDDKTITLTHIYTKAGTYYPVIRTVNSSGFLSKFFYDNNMASSATIPKPKEEVTNINPVTVNDGAPTNIIRVDNKVVKSGIDNDIFEEGPKDVYLYRPPILESGNTAGGTGVTLIVKYLEAVSSFRQNPDPTAATTVDADYGVNYFVNETETSVTGTAVKLSVSGQVARVLEVKQKNAKLVSDTQSDVNDFNKIKTFLVAKSDEDNYWYPITYVSNGDPIKKEEDRKVKLDFTQSRAKASNKSISKYYYDNGKGFFQASGNRWQMTTAGVLDDKTRTGDSTIDLSYTYMARNDGLQQDTDKEPFATGNKFLYTSSTDKIISNQFPINDWNQFFDQNHLVRVNVSSSGGYGSSLDTFNFFYRICPTVSTSATAAGGQSQFLDSYEPYGGTQNVGNNTYKNERTEKLPVSGWNTQNFSDTTDAPRDASNYFLIADTNKVNKIFFNTSPYARDLNNKIGVSGLTTVTGTTVAGVYYLKTGSLYDEAPDGGSINFTQWAKWVPLEFTDTTKVTREIRDASNAKFVEYNDSMAKPGSIEFDMPDDWSKVSISGLTGGIFNRSATPVTEPANTYSKVITGDYASTYADSSGFFNCIIVSSSGLSDFTSNDIGQFRYTYEVTGGANDGLIYWVASANTATNNIFLVSGQTHPINYSSGTALNGHMRRINAYEVFDGTIKLGGGPPILGDVPWASASSGNYPHTYMWSGASNRNTIRDTFVDVYPLKIVLSGGHFESGTSPGVEMWDALPYNSADSQIIVQRDNTAFDLSFMEITSNISVGYAGTYYSAISKNGKVTIIRTGTPIQRISFGGNAMGDEITFSYSENYKSYNTLHKLRRLEAEAVRVMWDEKQKDGTYVRFFGFVEGVSETHQVGGNRASKPYSFTMVVEEICLLDSVGNLMSEISPLGGIANANTYS
jgi:hypothetical protein